MSQVAAPASQDRPELARLRVAIEPDEQIFEIIHKHWGGIMGPVMGVISLALVTVIVFFVATLLGGIASAVTGSLLILMSVWATVITVFGLSEWYSYSQSAVIITNQRVIDCQQLNIISRRLQTIDIHEIQNVAGSVAAGWGTILDYGNLSVNTIGQDSIHISCVPAPETAAGQIMHFHNEVAHGGVSGAHNLAAARPEEDRTPQPHQITLAEPAAQSTGESGGTSEAKDGAAIIEAIETTPKDAPAIDWLRFGVSDQQLTQTLTALGSPLDLKITAANEPDRFELALKVRPEQIEALRQTLNQLGIKISPTPNEPVIAPF